MCRLTLKDSENIHVVAKYKCKIELNGANFKYKTELTGKKKISMGLIAESGTERV